VAEVGGSQVRGQPGAVAHICNPSYSRGKDPGGSLFKSSLGKYFARPYLENTQHKETELAERLSKW
jgi:hypothetical protein